jgi:hypothetical protein
MKSVCQRGTCAPVLAVALFKMTGYAVNWDAPPQVNAHNDVWFSCEKNESLSFVATWTELEGSMWSEIIQIQGDKSYVLICRG